MKGYQEIIQDNYESCCFLCASVFSSPFPCICCQNLCKFVLFSLVFSAWMDFSYTSLQLCSTVFYPSRSLPPFALFLLMTAHYADDKCADRKVTLAELPGWNPGLTEVGGKIPIDFSVARVSPFSFEVFSASESQHFCKLCFAPGSLIESEIRAERMVSEGHWPGKEFLGCQVLH